MGRLGGHKSPLACMFSVRCEPRGGMKLQGLGSKKTSEVKVGCQNELVKELFKLRPTCLNLFIT